MGRQSEAKDWSELIEDYKTKVATGEWTFVELIGKYKISSPRIYEILAAHDIEVNNPRKKTK